VGTLLAIFFHRLRGVGIMKSIGAWTPSWRSPADVRDHGVNVSSSALTWYVRLALGLPCGKFWVMTTVLSAAALRDAPPFRLDGGPGLQWTCGGSRQACGWDFGWLSTCTSAIALH